MAVIEQASVQRVHVFATTLAELVALTGGTVSAEIAATAREPD